MGIKEVPIIQGEPVRKKVSSRTREAAEKFLAQHHTNLEGLTETQQHCIFKYIRARKMVKWLAILAILAGTIFVICSYITARLMSRTMSAFMPDGMQFVLEDGTSRYFKFDEEQRYVLGMYGQMCAIFGGVLAATLLSAASVVGQLVGTVLTVRETKRTLEAFLPALRACEESRDVISS